MDKKTRKATPITHPPSLTRKGIHSLIKCWRIMTKGERGSYSVIVKNEVDKDEFSCKLYKHSKWEQQRLWKTFLKYLQ